MFNFPTLTLTIILCKISKAHFSRSGGTGRRAGLKNLSGQPGGSSILPFGTTITLNK